MSSKKNLVIVESPAKAKTLKKFLGTAYKIEASMGHVRDLPKSELGIDVDNDFEPKYITIRGKGDLLAKLRKEAKNADKVYLATDPDREGEAISWHLLSALKIDETKARRITFNEITKSAVKNSIKQARDIDLDLVDAQQARRALDRIVGYKISPLLWKKVKKGLSAGRVQSVALKLICDREEEINNFIPEEYWSLDVNLSIGKKNFNAKFYGKNGKKLTLNNEQEVNAVLNDIKDKSFIVTEIKNGSRNKKSPLPFTTSTMQQEASKILNFASNKTMSVAQQLYEGVDIKGEGTIGLVTYIRTDSYRVADEAHLDAKNYINENFGDDFFEKNQKKVKLNSSAQDAHEAIRPTSCYRTPDSIKTSLTNEQYKLYKLIWERFIASNMTSAKYTTQSVKIRVGEYDYTASGSILDFEGYLIVYKKNEDKQKDIIIPSLEIDEELNVVEILPEQHFTQPPSHFTEALLIRTLEEIGVGRPSTYAPTIATIYSRGYVTKEQKAFYTTELGEIVNEIIKNNFKDIVDVNFTANLEKELDEIEDGKEEWKEVLRRFYPSFKKELDEAEEKLQKVEIEDEKTDVICENCGRNMVIKYSKYGKFLACPGYPECRNTKPLLEEAGVNCPHCNGKVYIKKTKKGRRFYGCENNPDCNFMTWSKPTGKLCPKCNEPLVEKGKNKKIIGCSNQNCNYKE